MPQERESPKVSLPKPLMRRARNAARIFGFTGPRDFSKFVEMALGDWLDSQARLRGDGDFPDAEAADQPEP